MELADEHDSATLLVGCDLDHVHCLGLPLPERSERVAGLFFKTKSLMLAESFWATIDLTIHIMCEVFGLTSVQNLNLFDVCFVWRLGSRLCLGNRTSPTRALNHGLEGLGLGPHKLGGHVLRKTKKLSV